MNDIPILETERLRLRPLTTQDAIPLHPMFNDAQTMRFMPTLPHQTIAETEAHLKQEIEMPGAVNWTICLKETNVPIGIVNYLGSTRIPGMGYIIQRDYWGQGITVEACQAALRDGFAEQNLAQVELWINQANLASRRVAEKLNFQLKGRIQQKYSHETEYHVMMVYGLWAAEWRGEGRDTAVPQLFRAEPVLYVHDIVATTNYYKEKLGFHIDFLFGDPPNHAGVSRGNWTGNLVSIQLSQVPPERIITPAGHLYIFVSAQIDALYQTYLANGVEIVHEPASYPWGLREFTIRDLNGHILRFGTHI